MLGPSYRAGMTDQLCAPRAPVSAPVGPQFVVDTVLVNTLVRSNSGWLTHAGGRIFSGQPVADRGLLADNPKRSQPPLLLSLWQVVGGAPPADEVPTLFDLRDALAPSRWMFDLLNAPAELAAFLVDEQAGDDEVHHRCGFQMQLWLDQVHVPIGSERRGSLGPVWPSVYLLNVPTPAVLPDSPLVVQGRLLPLTSPPTGDLRHRAAHLPSEIQYRWDRVIDPHLVMRMTKFQPPEPGPFASLDDLPW